MREEKRRGGNRGARTFELRSLEHGTSRADLHLRAATQGIARGVGALSQCDSRRGRAMSLDAIRWAWMQTVGRSSAKLLLLSLADRANEDHVAYPSIERLRRDTELDRKTVTAAIAYLESLGLLEIEHGNGIPNRYRLVGVEGREDVKKSVPQPSPKTDQVQKRTRSKNGPPPGPKTDRVPGPKLGHEPTSRTYQEPRERESSGLTPRARPTRLVEAPALSLSSPPDGFAEFVHATRPELDPARVWVEFREYYTEGEGRDVCRGDWRPEWKRWVRREIGTPTNRIDRGTSHDQRSRDYATVDACWDALRAKGYELD